jgi:hypothetical protein
MKIKWNWGTGIFLAGAAFMLMLVVFAFFMFNQEFDLVEKDYYPKALEYQQKIDKSNNAKQLAEKVRVETKEGIAYFIFPSAFDPDSLKGTIYFYRPSEKSGDLRIAIDPDSLGRMFFELDKLLTGRYLVKIDFTCDGKGYYQEEPLFVP